MKSLGTIITCMLLISLLLSGCSSPESEPANDTARAPSGEATIVCEVFYRPGAGAGLESAPLITFSEGNDQKAHPFATMSFEASFQDDAYEGQALRISITDLESGDQVSRQLYQFDSQNPVENQFIGGHGFTGLNYVFQPGSSAEMQYYCSVR